MKLSLVLVLAAIPLAAHHSTRGTFDDSRLVAMQGTIAEVQWMNPHLRFLMDVTGDAGKVTSWEIEGPSPNMLRGQGLKRDSLKTGDHVILDVWLGRIPTYGRHLASMRTFTLPDGRVISGKSGWDDPIKRQ